MLPRDRVARNASLDRRLEIVALEAGDVWSYERKFVSGHDQRAFVPDGFFPLYDVYPNCTITQMWNTLRVTRIQLGEDIIEDCASLKDTESMAELGRAKQVIVEMTREICAARPQMTNCSFAARQKLSDGVVPGAPYTYYVA